MSLIAVLVTIAVSLATGSGGYALARLERRLRLRPKAVALPGKSREEHDTEVFIEALHNTASDDIRLQAYVGPPDTRLKGRTVRRSQPLAIADRASNTLHNMARIRVYMDETRPLRKV